MNLSQLYYFKRLAELEHYTRTAKELFITQPSLSESISSLESELGVRLFQKEGRNIKLNKYGKVFYGYVCDSLQLLEKGIAITKEQVSDTGGRIEIGCIDTILGDFMVHTIHRYQEAVSKATQFRALPGSTSSIIAGIKTGIYDVGFCSRVDNEPDLVFLPLFPQQIIAIVNTGHPLSKRDKISLADLEGQQVYTYTPDIQIGKDMAALVKGYSLDIRATYTEEISIGGYVSLYPVVGLVAETPSLARFPELVRLELTDVPEDYRQIHMVYSKKNYMSRPCERFISFVSANREELMPKKIQI